MAGQTPPNLQKIDHLRYLTVKAQALLAIHQNSSSNFLHLPQVWYLSSHFLFYFLFYISYNY